MSIKVPVNTAAIIADVAGPFFLGFSIEAFGMGVVLILSIDYFASVITRPKTPSESSRRLGVILVSFTLFVNALQTILDLCRGWNMFATNFLSLTGFLKPTPIFFISPFLGLFPALLTQLFLLRRATLFIKSLSSVLWTKLGHPVVRWAFGLFVAGMSILAFIAGTIVSVEVWKSGNLFNVRYETGSLFAMTEELWLATSSAVDLILSGVLCSELWWARRRLAAKGGGMREVVTRLILVTLHGGLAVSILQITTVFLYRYSRRNAFSYLPILVLPKVYDVTLILSLSLPISQGSTPHPSRPFSLPTIISLSALNPPDPEYEFPPPPPSSRQPHALPLPVTSVSIPKDKAGQSDQEKGTGVRGVLRRSWRRSQDWVSWSLVGTTPRSGEHTQRRHSQQEDKDRHRLSNKPTDPDSPNSRQTFLLNGDRRPSEANSMSPLIKTPNSDFQTRFKSPLSPPTPKRASRNTHTRISSLGTYGFGPTPSLASSLRAYPPGEHITQAIDPSGDSPTSSYPQPQAQPPYLSQHASYSLNRDPLDAVPPSPTSHTHIPPSSSSHTHVPPSPTYTNFRSTINDSTIFEHNPDPFASYRSLIPSSDRERDRIVAVRPSLEVVQSSRFVVAKHDYDENRLEEARGEGDDGEESEGEDKLRAMRGKGRMLSFQDMLDGPWPVEGMGGLRVPSSAVGRFGESATTGSGLGRGHKVGVEDGDEEDEDRLRNARGKGRMLSFQDMLDGPPPR